MSISEGHSVRYTHRRLSEADARLLRDRWPAVEQRERTKLIGSLATSARLLREEGEAVAIHGGVTVARILNAEGESVASARAFCSPLDTFSYKLGRLIAGGRALKQLERRSVEVAGTRDSAYDEAPPSA